MEYFISFILVFILLANSRYYNNTILNINNIKYERKINNISKVIIVYSFIILVLLAGLRYEVGTDYTNYKNMFYMLQNESIFTSNIEIGFVIICKILSIFTDKYVYLFIVSAFITYYFLFKISLKKTYYYELSIFLFLAFGFYTSTFNTVRQWMACMIGFYMLVTINERSNIKNIIYIILALLFHRTSIILLIVYYFIKNNKSDLIRSCIVCISTLLYFMPNVIMDVLSFIVKNIKFLEKYGMYINGYSIDLNSSFVFPSFCIIVYILYKMYKFKLYDYRLEFNTYINVLTLAYSFSCIGQKLMSFNRIQMFFMPILIIIIPQIILVMDNKERKFAYWMCIIMGTAFFLYTLKINGGDIFPYKNILFNY